MNRSGFVLFLGVTLGASALLSVGAGCSSSTAGTGGSGGGTTSSSTSSSSSSTTSSSSSTTASSSGTVATLDCTSYCTEIMANCTGAQQQFSAMDTCMGTCAAYPPGALTDMAGDTLGCRIYHGGAPAKADPITHCPHAGPTGGDKDPKGTTGTCGEDCDAFCTIALVVCAGQPSDYSDKATCLTECQAFKADVAAYSTADIMTNDMGCRMYHLTAASPGGTAATTHCPHIRATSTQCTM